MAVRRLRRDLSVADRERRSQFCCRRAIKSRLEAGSRSPGQTGSHATIPSPGRGCPLSVVHRGRDPRARAGTCSVYESDSAAVLADRHESPDRQAASRPQCRPASHPSSSKTQLRGDRHPRLSAEDAERPDIGERQGGLRQPVATCLCSGTSIVLPGAGGPLCPVATTCAGPFSVLVLTASPVERRRHRGRAHDRDRGGARALRSQRFDDPRQSPKVG